MKNIERPVFYPCSTKEPIDLSIALSRKFTFETCSGYLLNDLNKMASHHNCNLEKAFDMLESEGFDLPTEKVVH